MTKLRNKILASEVDHGAAEVLCLFMSGVLTQQRKWLNGHIVLHEPGRNPIEHYKMYQFLAVLLFSDLSGISLEKIIESLFCYDCITPKAGRVSFVLRQQLWSRPTFLIE